MKETFLANVRFLVWEDSNKPKEYIDKNIKVVRSGMRYTFYLNNGLIFYKKIGSYGTEIERVKQ